MKLATVRCVDFNIILISYIHTARSFGMTTAGAARMSGSHDSPTYPMNAGYCVPWRVLSTEFIVRSVVSDQGHE